MKEQMTNVIPNLIGNLDSRSPIGVEDKFRGNDKGEGLTTHPFPPTLGREGDIFSMDAGRPTEGVPITHQPTPEAKGSASIFPELTTEKLLQETGVDRIKTSGQLIAFVSNFQEESRQAPSKNPFKDWSIDRLKKQYLAWHVNTSKIEHQQETFGEKEAVSGHAQPYNDALIEELERRQVDIRELFLESTKRAAEAGAPVRSIGASQQTRPPEGPAPEPSAAETGGPGAPPPPEAPPAAPAGEEPEEQRQGVFQALFPDVDTLDPRLQLIARIVDSRRAAGQADLDFIEEQIRRIGDITIERDISDTILNQAAEMAGRLYEVRDETRNELLSERREESREQQRYGIFGERKLTRGEKELIKAVVLGQELTRDQLNRMTPQEAKEFGEADVDRRKFLVDRIFNRMFENADANPKIEFNQSFSAGNYEYLEFTRTINEARAEADDPTVRQRILENLRKYVEERKLRESAHNVNYVVIADRELDDLINFVKGFQSEQADLAFSKKGVVSASHFYEQALLKVREENNGYIPNYAVVGEAKEGSVGRVEELTRKYMDEAVRVGALPEMEEWEINRAISLARGMGIINGRIIEIASTSKLPGDKKSIRPKYVSVYAQKIVAYISPFRHLTYKFNIFENANKVFGFLLDRKKGPWTKEELADFKTDAMLDVINGLVEDKDARFLGVVNPFKVGGILSRTTWRINDDPVVGATGDFVLQHPGNRNLIGTGIWIERMRGDLNELDSKNPDHWAKDDQDGSDIMENGRHVTKGKEAERIIGVQLNKIARNQPLKLFFNLKGSQEKLLSEDLQKAVLRRLGKANIDPELKDDLDTLVVLQEKAMRDALNSPDKNEVPLLNMITADTVGDPAIAIEAREAKAERLRRFVNAVKEEFTEPQDRLQGRSHLDKFVEDLREREWKIPFNIGTDDVPFDEYKFAKTGSNSFSRRWDDIGTSKPATAAILELVDGMFRFKRMDEIVPVLKKLHNAIALNSTDLAREVTMKAAEGVMKFYKKDWYARLPFGIGMVIGATGRHSFAELAGGKGQMSWDELNSSGFTSLIRDANIISLEQQKQLQEKAGGTRLQAVYAFSRIVVPLLTLAFIYYVSTKVVSDEKR